MDLVNINQLTVHNIMFWWQELQIANVSQYLGRFCSIHVAEYTALVMGMETALQHGVRHLTIMCDSELVFNQVRLRIKLHVQEFYVEEQLHPQRKFYTGANSVSPLLVCQVTGKWTACHSSIRELKSRVRELLNEFQTCGALYISPKCNSEAQSLAQKAIDSSSDSTSVSR